MKTRAYALLLFLFIPIFSWSQCPPFGSGSEPAEEPCPNPIVTALPVLGFDPSPESMALGGVGVVASADNYSTALSQNPALMARGQKIYDAHFSYMPLFRALRIRNFHILNLGGMTSIGERQAVGLNLKYLSLGEHSLVNVNGVPFDRPPYELVFSGHYAYQLGENFSVGLGAKFIVSDFGTDQSVGSVFQPIKTAAADLGLNYRVVSLLKDGKSLRWDIGFAINNIGPKVSYTRSEQKEFIPTVLRLGNRVGLGIPVASKLSLDLGLAYQLNKFLVPTPCFTAACDADNNGVPDYQEQSVISGIFNSFGDAPEGFTEELREINHDVGFNLDFILEDFGAAGFRAGYSYQHPTKGGRQALAAGVSLRWDIFLLDYALSINPKDGAQRSDWMYALRLGVRDAF